MNRETPDFSWLYAEYSNGIYRLCLRMTGSASDAEDLTQDTFLAVMQGWHRFRGEASPLTWIYRIAARKARRHVRLRAFRLAPPERPTSDRDLAVRIDFARALTKLSVSKREAFLLVKVEGLTLKQAAEVACVPEGTMKFRVHEAIRSLRISMGESYEYQGVVHGHEV
jgi:RNA polymerase sigma-70 factor (ECF subfamily)